MKKISSLLVFLAILLSGQNTIAQLSGTYSIDSTGVGDYQTFTAAVSDLSTYGVNGPTVFLVEPGTYNEQIVIPAISGASATNTITFSGNAADSLSVVLTFNQSSFPANHVVKLDGADHIKFQKLSIQSTGLFYSKVIIFENQASYNTLSNRHIVGQSVSYNYEDNAVISS